MKKIMLLMALVAAFSMTAFAEDGAALYKAKCAMCHGPTGAGTKMAPKLAGTTKSAAQIAAVLAKGGLAKAPHSKPLASVTGDQGTAIAAFVKSLK